MKSMEDYIIVVLMGVLIFSGVIGLYRNFDQTQRNNREIIQVIDNQKIIVNQMKELRDSHNGVVAFLNKNMKPKETTSILKENEK